MGDLGALRERSSAQYRAAATLGYQHDEADRESRRIICPTLVLWSQTDAQTDAMSSSPLEIWKTWTDDVRGSPIPVGHFMPEAAPDETAHPLIEFLASGDARRD